MDIDITKSERGYIRAMARELLVNGRVNNVPDAIQMAEELINETTYTLGNGNELERNRSR